VTERGDARRCGASGTRQRVGSAMRKVARRVVEVQRYAANAYNGAEGVGAS